MSVRFLSFLLFCFSCAIAIAEDGSAIYNRSCIACHQSGVAGSPRKGDENAWQQRLEAVGGLDNLVESAIRGKGAMPPKGICGTCTKEELKSAVEYMIQP